MIKIYNLKILNRKILKCKSYIVTNMHQIKIIQARIKLSTNSKNMDKDKIVLPEGKWGFQMKRRRLERCVCS